MAVALVRAPWLVLGQRWQQCWLHLWQQQLGRTQANAAVLVLHSGAQLQRPWLREQDSLAAPGPTATLLMCLTMRNNVVLPW